jgi:hypothetical protein
MRAERSEIMAILNNLAATGYACRRARNTGSALAAWTLIAAGVLAGCSSAATGPSSAALARPAVSAASAAVAARVFVSRTNGYAVSLPAGWSVHAAQPWRVPPPQGHENGSVDIFYARPYAVAWAFAAPAQTSLAAFATATTRAGTELQCPAQPQIDQPVTIGGAPALLIGMSCPSQGGVLMLTAVTTHKQKTLAFEFEDSSGVTTAARADRVAFREFLTGVRFR